jgi:hypothetical protein
MKAGTSKQASVRKSVDRASSKGLPRIRCNKKFLNILTPGPECMMSKAQCSTKASKRVRRPHLRKQHVQR